MGFLCRYMVEIFLFRDEILDDKKGLDKIPNLEDYKAKTEMLDITTWDSIENEILRRYPNAGYIHIQSKDMIETYNNDDALTIHSTELLIIKNSAIHARGVFPKRDIKRGEILLLLGGEVVDMKERKEDYPSGEWNALSGSFFLVRENRTIYGYMNHSRTPNAQINISTFEVVALTAICEGDEITIDYRREPLPEEYLNGFGKNYL